MRCYKLNEKTGKLIGFKAVILENELLLITDQGIIMRMKCENISVQSRNTSGVKLMNLNEGVHVASIAKVRDADTDDESEETGVTDDSVEEDEQNGSQENA